MKLLPVVLLLFFSVLGCTSLQVVEEKPCKDNTELIQDALLDLELIENDIKYYSEMMALPKEERPKLRCGTCFEEELEEAQIKKDALLDQLKILIDSNC